MSGFEKLAELVILLSYLIINVRMINKTFFSRQLLFGLLQVCSNIKCFDSVLTYFEFSTFGQIPAKYALSYLLELLKVDSSSLAYNEWQRVEMV